MVLAPSIALALAAFSQAQSTVVIPARLASGVEGGGAVSAPWSFRLEPCQDLYFTNEFTSQGITQPIEILQLRWRAEGNVPLRIMGPADVTIRIGSASDSLNNLTRFSLDNFDGIPPLAFEGAVQFLPLAATLPNSIFYDITLDQSVVYDPSAGKDLVVETIPSGVTPRVARDSSIGGGMVLIGGSFPGVRGGGPYCEVVYSPATRLVPGFVFERGEVGTGEAVRFRDRSFSPDAAGVTAWAWDFDGDGIVDSTDRDPSFAFATCGRTTITLTVTDAGGSATRTMFGPTVVRPVPSFDYVAGAIPGTVQFTDTSTFRATSWSWDFDGNGTTDSVDQNPVWTPPPPGRIFNTRLTVGSACGSGSTTAPVDTRSQLCAPLNGPFSLIFRPVFQFFDLEVLNPSGITLTSLDLHIADLSGGGGGQPVNVIVRVAPGPYREPRPRWVEVATANGISAGFGMPTVMDIGDLTLLPGTHAVSLEVMTAPGEFLHYSRPFTVISPRPQQVLRTADVVLRGTGMSGGLGCCNVDPRHLNGCVNYVAGAPNGGFSPFAAGCALTSAAAPILTASAPRVGLPLTLTLERGPASAVGAILFSDVEPPAIDLALIGAPNCVLHAAPFGSGRINTDALGQATFTAPIGAGAGLIGLKFWAQAALLDPAANTLGVVLSSAGAGIIGR